VDIIGERRVVDFVPRCGINVFEEVSIIQAKPGSIVAAESSRLHACLGILREDIPFALRCLLLVIT